MHLIPTVIDKTHEGERAYDIYSRLLKDRIVILGSQVDENSANSICAQLLFLAAEDDKKDIYFYINSPGGAVTHGMAIYDTMQFVKPDVSTICLGQAASMGAFLLSSGAKGKRYCLPQARVMIHQPLGGAQGQATDIEIQAKEILRIKEILTRIMAENTGKDYEVIKADKERDYFMSAIEAKNYGIVDHVIKNASEIS